MAEIYIRTDPTTKVVTFVHRRPFDPINGLGATREELLKTGFFVNEFPSPNSTPGLRAIAYYDHESKNIRYEYQPLPFSEKSRLDMLESVVTGILKQYPNIINIILSSTPMMMSLDDSEDIERYQNEETNKRRDMMSRFSEFLAYQIHNGKMSKEEVFELYPELEEDVQTRLDEWNIIPDMQIDDIDEY